jgi:hypothetical protein
MSGFSASTLPVGCLIPNSEVHMADNPFTDRNRPKPPGGNAPPLSTLIGRSIFVVLTNLVSLGSNGVLVSDGLQRSSQIKDTDQPNTA